MAVEEVEGIVLFHRKHRERDLLVKLFTDRFGKLMFFARRPAQNQAFSLKDFQPFSTGCYIADIKPAGLSFLRSTKVIANMTHIYGDIYKHAFATYLCNLADAALEDRQNHFPLYCLLKQAIQAINNGLDAEIISHIFEIKIMQVFGVKPNWQACAVCGEKKGKFDYSPQYHSIICPKHYYLDQHRYHADPRAIYFARQFSHLDLSQLSSISLKKESKQAIASLIDQLYEENVGIRLKSKSFIDRLEQFELDQVDWSKRDRNTKKD